MTLLEVREALNGAVEDWTAGALPPPAGENAVIDPPARRSRGARGAGLARLEDLERQALAIAEKSAGRDAGASLALSLEAVFAEARGLLSEQFADLDHCLKQAYGARPVFEAPAADGAGFERLTTAEKRVFTELAKGKPNKIIAYDLSISEATVKAHVSKVLKKLKVHSRNRAIALFAPRGAE